MLGRDEKNRIFCEYVGNEDDCPNTCLRCAVNVLEKGNEALSHGEVKEALRFYKRSAFIEPKYSDAWFHIGQTYRLMCEYNNALLALNKALSIDSQYGDALLEKANTLIQLGRFEEAMTILNNIIELYDASSAHQLKEHLIQRGIKDTANKLSLSCAVDLMTEQAMNIIKESNLLNDKGRISTEKEIYCKEEFAARTVKLCRKVFLSFGEDKIQSESMLTAFYGSICTTLFYYDSPDDFEAIFPFDYLFSHVDVDKTEETAERLLGILSNETASEALWSVIYPFVQYSKGVIARIENEADRVSALIDATESVYMMGMLYAMRYHEQQASCDAVSNIEQALEKLAQSSKEYDYTPPRRDAMCYSIAEPDGEFNFICARCGKHSSIRVYEDGGNEQRLLSRYQEVAVKFRELGFTAYVDCYCEECIKVMAPSKRYYEDSFMFSLSFPGSTEVIWSFPSTWSFSDLQYRVALAFLQGENTIEKISQATNTRLSAKTYLDYINTVLGTTIGLEGINGDD